MEHVDHHDLIWPVNLNGMALEKYVQVKGDGKITKDLRADPGGWGFWGSWGGKSIESSTSNFKVNYI